MPTADILRQRRDRARQREERVEELLRGNKLTLVELGKEITAEREERAHLTKRRKSLRIALEDEIQADEEGKGKHGEGWEQWASGRRDELADLIDGCEGRIDRLIVVTADTREVRKELAKRDRRLEKRIALIEKRLARKERPENQLSPNFSVAEFDCRNGTPVPVAALPALKALCIVVLEPQRAKFGSVYVNSGYRTAAYNAAIGGATNSIHIYDQHPNAVAADHICSSGNARNWFDNTAGKADGRGLYASFHHSDNRNRIGWPDAIWSG